ncbi:MAG: hypothetical protein R3B72_43325 [Polyangiaceae bacterium]
MRAALDHLREQRPTEAASSWRAVLSLDPDHGEARTLLAALDNKVLAPSTPRRDVVDIARYVPPRSEPLELHIAPHDEPAPDRDFNFGLTLIQRGHFEEALSVLRPLRRLAPDDERLSVRIREAAEGLLRALYDDLGDLDEVPRRVKALLDDAPATLREVFQLVDGIVTYDDILASSHLGRLTTCKRLVELLEGGYIASVPRQSHSLPSRSASSDPQKRARRKFRNTREFMVPKFADAELDSSDDDGPPSTSRAPTLAPPAPDELEPSSHPSDPEPSSQAPKTDRAPTRDEWQERFAAATRAYLRRDLDEAIRLFERCLAERPDDKRTLHNLEKLRKRRRKP